MKLQLFLDNNEVDLIGTEVFPVTKTFNNLFNPLDIITEYSKSINIPISLTNNRILANSYRLDRELVYDPNHVGNISLYFDPNKKIPMKLVYNGDVILDGYAKFVSSTSSIKDNYYTLTLFGILGEIFQKLKKVVVSADKLTEDQKEEEDGGAKYILKDFSLNSYKEPTKFNKDFVSKCWDRNFEDNIDPLPTDKDYFAAGIEHIYGAAPTYCGYYPDFDSSRVQLNQTTSAPISECLRDAWIQQYYENKGITSPSASQKEAAQTFVDNLDPDSVVGDGFKNYQMLDYRAYKQRPFIFFNKLFYMFKNKMEEISDYKLVLDDNWFNISNPYWARMCYMFDFLQKDGQNEYSTTKCWDDFRTRLVNSLTGEGEKATITQSFKTYLQASSTKSTLITAPTVLVLDLKLDKNINFPDSIQTPIVQPMYGVCWQIQITCGNKTHTFYASTASYQDSRGIWPWGTFPTESNFLTLNVGNPPDNLFGFQNNQRTNEWCAYINIPSLAFTGDFEDLDWANVTPVQFTVTTATKYAKGSWIPFTSYANAFFTVSHNAFPQQLDHQTVDVMGSNGGNYNGSYNFGVKATNCQLPWYDIDVGLKTFYDKEEPLFDVIIQYTKMFGLLWSIDYIKKEIHLQRRETLFKDYTIEDWDDKLDKTQNMVVEPVSFPTKYVKMGYKETDGYRYTAYRDQFGAEFGDKIIETLYDFNVEENSITKDIPPTIASNRNFVSYKQWLDWDCINTIVAQRDPTVKIECADEDDESSIDAGNWCMRNNNNNYAISDPYYITDDSDLMTAENKSYYYDYRAIEQGLIEDKFYYSGDGLPIFSPIWVDENDGFNTFKKAYSCLFNTPQIDYTTDGLFKSAQGNTVYNICWEKFINERYNSQNKKVTAFFNLSLPEFNQFKFNKFVTLDNQLFMVNKISDFEPTQSKSTQCELIQISDVTAYTTPRDVFNKIDINSNAILVNGVYTLYTDRTTGTFYFNVRSYPESTATVNVLSSDRYSAILEDVEKYPQNVKTYYISYDLTLESRSDFLIELTIGGKTTPYPCSIRRLDETQEVVTTGYAMQTTIKNDPTYTHPRVQGAYVYQVGNLNKKSLTNSNGQCILTVDAGLPAIAIVESPNQTVEQNTVLTIDLPRTDPQSSMTYTLLGINSAPLETVRASYIMEGVVVNTDTQEPISGLEIRQMTNGTASIMTTTDSNGFFRLPIMTGLYNRIKMTDGIFTHYEGLPTYYEGTYTPMFRYEMDIPSVQPLEES